MNQSPRTIQQQIAILKSRGMAFSDENLATSYLTRISYFRLKYYWTDMFHESVVLDMKTEFGRNSDPFVRNWWILIRQSYVI